MSKKHKTEEPAGKPVHRNEHSGKLEIKGRDYGIPLIILILMLWLTIHPHSCGAPSCEPDGCGCESYTTRLDRDCVKACEQQWPSTIASEVYTGSALESNSYTGRTRMCRCYLRLGGETRVPLQEKR